MCLIFLYFLLWNTCNFVTLQPTLISKLLIIVVSNTGTRTGSSAFHHFFHNENKPLVLSHLLHNIWLRIILWLLLFHYLATVVITWLDPCWNPNNLFCFQMFYCSSFSDSFDQFQGTHAAISDHCQIFPCVYVNTGYTCHLKSSGTQKACFLSAHQPPWGAECLPSLGHTMIVATCNFFNLLQHLSCDISSTASSHP